MHLVAFDVPSPPNYGGAIDVFYKIKALHALGIRIILHCFEYGRGQSAELNLYCERVYYYKRKNPALSLFHFVPYIVSSRRNKELVGRLTKDNFPVLFEGLHTCDPIKHPGLKHKKKAARMHNVEWMYYAQLAKQETNLLRKIYYKTESIRLKQYEYVLRNAEAILAINQRDCHYFGHYGHSYTLYPFQVNQEVTCAMGKGSFVLYHGNLSVNENSQAVFLLLDNVIARLPHLSFVIAGKEPSSTLIKKVEEHKNVRLIVDPSPLQLEELIQNAHVHLLPTFQNTGVKLKLLHALFSGRHCVVNRAMVDGLDMLDTCLIEDDLDKWPGLIETLFKKDFDITDKEKREELFSLHFDNEKNAEKLVAILFDDKKE